MRYYLSRLQPDGEGGAEPAVAGYSGRWLCLYFAGQPYGLVKFQDQEKAPDDNAWLDLGDTLDEGLSTRLKTQLDDATKLSVEGATLRQKMVDMVVAKRLITLRPSKRRQRWEIWLGDLIWSAPVLAGGAAFDDDFDRGDADALGGSFAEDSGDFDIISSACSVQATGWARWTDDLDSDDHWAEVVITKCDQPAAGSTQIGAAVCMDSGAQSYYTYHRIRVFTGVDTSRLRRYSAGSGSNLGTGSAISLSDVVRTEKDGTAISGILNSSTDIGPVTNSDVSGFLEGGIHGVVDAADECRCDDFAEADLIVARIMGPLAGHGGLAGIGGIAGRRGGIAG